MYWTADTCLYIILSDWKQCNLAPKFLSRFIGERRLSSSPATEWWEATAAAHTVDVTTAAEISSVLLTQLLSSCCPEFRNSGHQYWTKRLKFPPKCVGTFWTAQCMITFSVLYLGTLITLSTWELWCNNDVKRKKAAEKNSTVRHNNTRDPAQLSCSSTRRPGWFYVSNCNGHIPKEICAIFFLKVKIIWRTLWIPSTMPFLE